MLKWALIGCDFSVCVGNPLWLLELTSLPPPQACWGREVELRLELSSITHFLNLS
jgi:hypothetical protein